MAGTTNLLFGWGSILAGFLTGAVSGLSFWREEWLGGYSSWRRRMVRLAHISFFGLGLINIAFALSLPPLGLSAAAGALRWSSPLLIIGNVAMPTVCYLSAWRMSWRHLFAVPVASVMLGVILFLAAAGAR